MKLRLAIAVALAFAAAAAQAQSPAPADVVFINGKVFTADGGDQVVQGFAIKGDRFVAAGSDGEMHRYVGAQTRVVDLKGHFVSPGITDDHFHNEGGGSGVDLSHVRSLGELLTTVANAAASAPAGTVVVSNSDWHEAQLKEQRLPTADELEQAAPGKPVVLVRGGHEYILNQAALKKWNITRDTPVPAGGQISRNASGELTGELFDEAKKLVTLPPPKPVSMEDILNTQKALAPYGMTAVRIPGAYRGNMIEAYHLMKQAEAEAKLTLRWTVYMPGFSLRSAEAARKAIQSWGTHQGEGDDWVKVDGVKLMVDGGFEGGHLSKPYLEPYGKGGTFTGLTVSPPAAYTEVVRELNRDGWHVITHAVGDAALDEVLDAYAAADKDASIKGKRWSVEHAFVSRPGQVARLKELDIAVSTQDHLYLAAPVLKKYWGWEIAHEVTPVKTYLDAGLLVAGGTDSPVVPFNPFWNLYHMASRDTISDGVYGEDQKIASRPLLLRLVTINYARLIGEEKTRGSIEPGKLADFAVLTDDFLTVKPQAIRDMKALSTWVGGREVYRAAGYE
ncbi:amidohydrolase [Bradyrhizobium sp.]|uniref:amidohydrolase n=1 Tax=Bradyrhizobium sp. TaxID=376 RepID=UPI002389401D|nr:amidohydrolase [Bradyrhizobium sp.]MDE1933663.1 amidohydrolase [Bradyrhizobium sp.]